MHSKEEKVLRLFFNSAKHWHFDELLKESGLSRSRLCFWLKKYEHNGIIKRIKPKGKRPYYAQIFSASFRNKKKLFALKQLTESGLLNHLSSLDEAKVIIIFGSFIRADWYEHSDIDIFIYGNSNDFEQGRFELKLKRDIQLHTAKDKNDLRRIDKMLPYIFSGMFVKGTIEDLGVKINV